MIIIFDFEIPLEEYADKGRKNGFPMFDRCPDCNCIAQGNVHRNGFYYRNGIKERVIERIPICRFRCLACRANISILPSFLIPYYQHTLHTIVERIRCFLEEGKHMGNRQLLSQYIKRFYQKHHWIHTFFADSGHTLAYIQDGKKRAQKYMRMILDVGISTFFRRSWGHLSTYFMGRLILPYLS